jgi:histidine ammonia-lyase
MISTDAAARVTAGRRAVEALVASGTVAYGINTGVGELCTTRIAAEDVRALQRNLLLSHAVGVGEPLPEATVRAALIVRANQLCAGYSGVRLELVEALLELLNRRVYPRVPRVGSLGASGDLAPSAHAFLVLIGAGEARAGDRWEPGAAALQRAGLQPLTLEPKEGLALLNGTHFMAGAGALLMDDARRLLLSADVVLALTLEALRGSRTPFDPRVHALRPHPGALLAAQRIFALTDGSAIMESHLHCDKVQDAYSLRCGAQVHGASADALAFLERTVVVELNASTDNPLIFPEDGAVLSGGNFHGQALALALDLAGIALAELGGISERRAFRLLAPELSGLPAFLTSDAGRNTGYMLAQYTAAALVTDNRLLAAPASVHTLPTSGNQEDHVSMGWTAALKAQDILRNVEIILGVEVLCAVQGLDFLQPLRPGAGTARAHAAVRARVPHLAEDRLLEDDLNAAAALIRDGTLAALAE